MISNNFLNDSKPQSHIHNLYEDLDMSLLELNELFSSFVNGEITEVQEKLDGQNLTFTVRNGRVEVYYKGIDWNGLQKPGKSYSTWDNEYSHLPNVKNAYKRSHLAIQNFVDLNKQLAYNLFQNGKLIMESAMIIPENPNTIIYNKPYIVFIDCYAMDPLLLGKIDYQAFDSWQNEIEKFQHEIKFSKVPKLKIKKFKDSKIILNNLSNRLKYFQDYYGLNNYSTIGDLLIKLAKSSIVEMGIGETTANKIASRIVTGNKSHFKKEQTSHAPWVWNVVQKLESSYFKEKSCIPLENLIHDFSNCVFENLEFQIASNDKSSGNYLRKFVKEVKRARKNNKIIASSKQLSLIDVCLERIGDEDRFLKPVEGIVFKCKKNKIKKLTGLFTPINRLRGVFVYGESPAKILK